MSEALFTAGRLPSTGITRLHRYFAPLRHPLVSNRLPGVAGYTIGVASVSFLAGRGGLLQLLSASLSACRRFHPAEEGERIGQIALPLVVFARFLKARPSEFEIFEATSPFTCVTAC